MQKLKAYCLEQNKSAPTFDLLNYISPTNSGREDKTFLEFKFGSMHVVDAMTWEKPNVPLEQYPINAHIQILFFSFLFFFL